MAQKYETLGGLFTSIADKIRGKLGTADKIVADDFPEKIGHIVTLSEGSADADATAADIIYPKAAYVKGVKVVGEYVKGKRCSIGTITVNDGNQTISTPDLDFKPEGAMFMWVGEDGRSIVRDNSVCAVACSDYALAIQVLAIVGVEIESYVSNFRVEYGETSISITNTTKPFPMGETMMYVAWGD